MAQKADIHRVILPTHRKTHQVWHCPLPHGYAFDPNLAKEQAGAMRQNAENPSKTTLAPSPNEFVYLDVGLWACVPKPNYNFGLICGRNVWLCDYTPDVWQKPIPDAAWFPSRPEAPEPLRKFEEVFSTANHGFTVTTYAHVPGKYPPPADMLYIVLPDMHLPGVRNDLPCRADGKLPTYYDILKDLGLVRNNMIHLRMDPDSRARPATFLLKEDADIFGGAGKALEQFLFPLAAGDYTSNYKLVQMGDLFELWQGMNRWGTFFEKDASGTLVFDSRTHNIEIKVSDGPKSRVYEIYEQGAVDLLAHRVQGILLQHWRVFYSLDILEKKGKVEYLYGNHDVYLVDRLREYQLMNDNEANAKWRQLLGNLPLFKTHLFESNVTFEHGHRMDSFNSDGDWRGPAITELVFVAPFLRGLDPDRRSMYHSLSAADVHYHKFFLGKPISVFVMGHTHIPRLVYIQFRESPEGPRGKMQEYPEPRCLTC